MSFRTNTLLIVTLITCFCIVTVDQEDTIECGNSNCDNGHWFHLACIGETTTEEGNWFCPERCTNSGSVNRWTCRTDKLDELMKCAAADDCQRGGHFHKSCVPHVETDNEGAFFGLLVCHDLKWHVIMLVNCYAMCLVHRKMVVLIVVLTKDEQCCSI